MAIKKTTTRKAPAKKSSSVGISISSSSKNEKRWDEKILLMAKQGLYSNIHAKRKRIASGSGESMRKPGTKGAPTKANFVKSAKTAKKK